MPTGSPFRSFDTIKYEVDAHKATITLNRADALNALSPDMIIELRAAYHEAESDDNVWLLIVTGTGRAFCTGADVKAIPGDGKVINERPYLSTYEQWEAPQEGTPPFRTMAKPVLAAINGLCCGAGLDWVTTADIVIASENATFFDPHVSIGLVAGREVVRLARVLPRSVAMRMALMGKHERMSAQRAWELGLISEVVEHDRSSRTSPRDRRHRQLERPAGSAGEHGSRSSRDWIFRCTKRRCWPNPSVSGICTPKIRSRGRSLPRKANPRLAVSVKGCR